MVLRGYSFMRGMWQSMAVASMLCLTACSDGGWFSSDDDEVRLSGDRISVLAHRTTLEPSVNSDDISVTLPPYVTNMQWNLQRIPPIQHPALPEKLAAGDVIDVGDSAEGGSRLSATPVIANGLIYVIDGAGEVTARSADGDVREVVWKRPLDVIDENNEVLGFSLGNRQRTFLGGNIAYGNETLFATTGRGNVYALEAKTGDVRWVRSVKLPVRSAPVVYNDMVLLITAENRLYALDRYTGKTRWTHEGLKESTSFLGAAAPVAADGVVVVPYSSGEIYGLRAENGQRLWSDSLVSRRTVRSSLFSLKDIDATPVIAEGRVYAVGNDGVLKAYDLITGRVQWAQEVSGLQMPWVAGDFLFLLTTDNELVCVNTPDGRIKWVTQLPRYDASGFSWGSKSSESESGERIVWTGPVLARDRLFVVGSHGKMAVLLPYTGKIREYVDIPDETYLSPSVAANRMYVLSNNAQMLTLR